MECGHAKRRGSGATLTRRQGVAFAYISSVGASQVIVKSITGRGEQALVSAGSGTEPVWSRDGRHLYYRDGEQFVEVTYTTAPEFRVVSRTPLFAAELRRLMSAPAPR